MRRLTLVACVLLLLGTRANSQESIALTTPVPAVTMPALSGYQPGSLFVQVAPKPFIQVGIVGTTGAIEFFAYPCAPGCAFDTDAKVLTLINNLNTANLVTRSLWRRIFDRLVLDFPTRFVGGAVVQ